MLPADVISSLPAESLQRLSEYYRRLADDLASRAAEIARGEASRAAMRARKATLFEAAAVIGQYLESGLPYGAALTAAAAATGLDEAALDTAWRTRARKVHAENRNRQIIRLARRGLTNAQIGAETGLSAVQVGRILKRQMTG